jgi:predicted adenylyl cyclase CyaB
VAPQSALKVVSGSGAGVVNRAESNMARNIEIKAHVVDLSAVTARAAAIADEGPVEIRQDDTFFACERGRLKLRAFSAEEGELIFYRRTDQPGPKQSFYLRTPTASPDSLREALTLAYGEVGRVRKRRTLFMVGRTRIHLDEVEGLGEFLELEVVLRDGESQDVGVREAEDLMTRLQVQPSQLIDRAYVDLLTEKR